MVGVLSQNPSLLVKGSFLSMLFVARWSLSLAEMVQSSLNTVFVSQNAF